jgi:transposase-like protein
MGVSFKGRHFEKAVILQAVRWYLSYALSYRDVEELLAERGVRVDHSTIARWVKRYAPLLDKAFRRTKRKPGESWRLEETYIKVRGQWRYLYRAVDTCGETIDFLLTPKRDTLAAYRFLKKACAQNGTPRAIAIDGSMANHAGIGEFCKRHDARIEIRQNKYLNNLVGQDHRRIKRKTRPMLGFKSFRSAAATIAGIELVHQLRKRQNTILPNRPLREQFEALAA